MAYTSLSTYAAEQMAVRFSQIATTAALMIYDPRSTVGWSTSSEVTGGSPAYARKPLTWTVGGEDGTVTAQVTFDVPAGTTVAGLAFFDGSGKYVGATSLVEQKFMVQGQLTVTATYKHAEKFDV